MVSFPALILELDLLDGDSTRIGVEVGKYLIFRNPASVNFVGENELPGLIVDLQSEIWSFGAGLGTEVTSVVRRNPLILLTPAT